jgi:hypothetical protein
MTPPRSARGAAAFVALVVCLGSGLAAAVPASAPLAGNEREREAPKRPRDGGTPRDPEDGDGDDAPKKKPDAGAPREEPDPGERPPKDPDDGDRPPKDPDAGQAPPGHPECVHVRTEARYVAYGYDHVVEIANECEKAMLCTVMTDVNPETTSVSVAAGQTRGVVTFRGSPAREFKATVLCEEPDGDGE